jgi:DNA modification methylase
MASESHGEQLGRGHLVVGDILEEAPHLAPETFQAILADPPYFQVLLEHDWDTAWASPDDYLAWTRQWVRSCRRLLRPDGLFFIFGQLGKREHVWLHLCSEMAREMTFHDMLIWDRAVGYNERRDSFTPQYEMVLVLRQAEDTRPYFDKDAVRLPYDEETIQRYLRDSRYKDRAAREAHLRRGKFATNILRVPSLKGNSGEKVGHPSQKPLTLIQHLIAASTRPGDAVLDPFLGSGTTALACEILGRSWTGVEKHPPFAALARQRLLDHADTPRAAEQSELDWGPGAARAGSGEGDCQWPADPPEN